MSKLIYADEVKKRFPIMENDFGMVVNETLHKELDKIPTVKAIPLEKVKQAIEEIEQYLLEEECNGNHEKGIMFALEILKKNIGESKGGYVPDTNVGNKKQAEPCEDAVSRKDMYFKLTNGAYPNETIEQFIDRLVKELEDMPPVTPTRKKGQKMDKIKFVPLTYTNGEKTYIKTDTIVQLEEVGDDTCVYTIGNDAPLYVKERVDEILAKIGGKE